MELDGRHSRGTGTGTEQDADCRSTCVGTTGTLYATCHALRPEFPFAIEGDGRHCRATYDTEHRRWCLGVVAKSLKGGSDGEQAGALSSPRLKIGHVRSAAPVARPTCRTLENASYGIAPCFIP